MSLLHSLRGLIQLFTCNLHYIETQKIRTFRSVELLLGQNYRTRMRTPRSRYLSGLHVKAGFRMLLIPKSLSTIQNSAKKISALSDLLAPLQDIIFNHSGACESRPNLVSIPVGISCSVTWDSTALSGHLVLRSHAQGIHKRHSALQKSHRAIEAWA
jgi:hypothetical protein